MGETSGAPVLPPIRTAQLKIKAEESAQGIARHASENSEPAVPHHPPLPSSGALPDRRSPGSVKVPQAPPALPKTTTLGELRAQLSGDLEEFAEANAFDPGAFLRSHAPAITEADRTGPALAARALKRMFGKR